MNDGHGSEDFPTARLGECLAEPLQTGFASGDNNRTGEGVPHLRPMNVSVEGKLTLHDLKFVPESKVPGDSGLLRCGDVLFNNTNSPALVGKTALYELPDQRAFSNHMTRVRTRREVLDSRYCAYALHQRWRDGYFEAICNNHVSQASISREKLMRTEIPLPPVEEQRRITAKLDDLLARVAATRQRLGRLPTILRRFRESVLAAAASGRLTEDWREIHQPPESAARLYERILDVRGHLAHKKTRTGTNLADVPNDLPSIPTEWIWAPLGALTSKIVDGVHRTPNYVSAGVPFITVRNLTAGPGISFERTSFVTLEDHERFIARANPEVGDILISKDGTLGVVRAVRTNRTFSIFVSVALAKPVLRDMSDYLEISLSSPQVQAQMIGTGSGLQHLHLRDLQVDCVPLPPLDEQVEIVRRVATLSTAIDAAECRLDLASSCANQLSQAVIERAFRGDL